MKNKIFYATIILCVLLFSGCTRIIPAPMPASIEISNVQEKTSPPLDLFFSQIIGIPTELVNNTAVDDTIVVVNSSASCTAGDYFGMFNTEASRSYFAEISVIIGNNISLDTPIDFAFQTGDTAACFTRDLNVDGSGPTQTFAIQVGGNANRSIDITRIIVHILDNVAMDDSKFGGRAALTNGLVLRRVNGDARNIWNIKSNGEFGEVSFDKRYDDRSGAGLFGMTVRYTFAGEDKHGVVVRLEPGDQLEIIIQDDLTALSKFRIVGEGNLVAES